MLELEIFVSEFFTVDRFSAGTIVVSKVSSLEHEFGDYPVEAASLVAISVLTGAEFSEVSGGLWDDLVEEVEGHSTRSLSVDGDVEETLGHFC